MTRNASVALVLTGLALVCAVLGSVHAFSVFLGPLEQTFSIGRSTVSLVYSFSLVFLTFAVLIGPRLYVIMAPVHLLCVVGILGAIGALIAGFAKGMSGVWIGYSLCFGLANGLGYGFSLQYAARSARSRPGAAMGLVTAAYAFGAAVSPL